MVVKRAGRGLAAYAVLAVGTVITLLVCAQLPWLKERGSGTMLMIVVIIATWLGGWRPGVVGIGISLFVRAWYLPPDGSLAISSPNDAVRLAMYAFDEALIVLALSSRAAAVRRSRVSEDRLAAALTSARMGAWEKDLRTGAFWWSRGLEDIFGKRPGAFVPTYEEFLGYIHPEDRNFVSNAFTSSVESGTEFEIEHRIVRSDKDVRWIVTRGQIYFDAHGNPERLLGVAADITDRRTSGQPEGDHSAPVGLTALRGRL
jgi:PAS domain S-box-containing protein